MAWWDDLLDTAEGVFDKVIDYETVKTEAEAVANASLVSNANAAEPVNLGVTSNLLGSIPPIAIYLALGVGAILLLRR